MTTDQILEHWDFDADNCHEPLVEHAKQLERELNEAKNIIEKLLDEATDIRTRMAAFKIIDQ